jgi:RNA polymerase sigma-70 factor (ECF subfamily)
MSNQIHKTTEQLDEEKVLILKAQNNSKDFEPLYNEYFERIFRFVYQRVESKEEAADITSQVFLKALVNLKHFQIREIPFSAWLYRIAINEISSFYSKSKKDRLVNVDTMQLNNLFEESNSDLKEERIERILVALKHLTGDDLILVEMRFFEERSFKEIADIMKITENNAKVKVYRAIDKMKQKIF